MVRILSAWVGLGSNLGDGPANLRLAAVKLAASAGVELRARSPIYRTPPWGREDQPSFVNAVLKVDTRLTPSTLLQELLRIERAMGRQRDGTRWGPRLIDLDLLLYADRRVDLPGLKVPHPHLHERAFVLRPLADLDPDLRVPGLGRVADLLRETTGDELVPLPGGGWAGADPKPAE